MALKPPGAGDLRRLLRFDRRAAADDNKGNVEGDWATLIASRWGKLQATRGGEMTVGDRIAGNSYFDLWLRADVATQAIRTKDRCVDITSSDPAKQRIFDIKFAEVMTDDRAWVLVQMEAISGDQDVA